MTLLSEFTGQTSGPFSLTVNTPVTVADPNANSNNKSVYVQVLNCSGFTLSVAAAGQPWTIVGWTASTIPVRDGEAVVITPKAQNTAGTSPLVLLVWLLATQRAPQPDGPITSPSNVSVSGTVSTQDAADGTPGSPPPALAIAVAGTDGTDLRALLTDSTGKLDVNVSNTPLSVTPTFTAPSNANTAGNATSLHVKTAAGTLYGVAGYSSISQYVQLLDTNSLTSGATVPVLPVFLQAAGSFSIDYEDLGRAFATGIYVAFSSTETVFTTGTAGWIDAQYV